MTKEMFQKISEAYQMVKEKYDFNQKKEEPQRMYQDPEDDGKTFEEWKKTRFQQYDPK